jgi:Tfp pilus assembly protein PilE
VIRKDKVKERKEKGFTVTGVIIAVVLISILAAMIIPRFNRGYIIKLDVYNATHRLTLDLRLARRLAITKAKSYVLEFFDNYTKYKIYEEASGSGGAEENIVPPAVSCSGTSKFTFTKFGTLDSTVNGSLSLSADVYRYDITVYKTTGRAKLEKK